jgi:pyruvate,orthophosphate dikinase
MYRQDLNISDDWGTAVIVQNMVFGNLNSRSGSGVVFTRSPKGLSTSISLYGDFIFGCQGDDIVSGLTETFPISEAQRKTEARKSSISLEGHFPEIFRELSRIIDNLIYERGFNHQEIEFTFENDTKEGLYILQSRDMVVLSPEKIKSFINTETLTQSQIGTGIGIAGGALSGVAVFSETDIKASREQNPRVPLVLIRPDTVPEDIGLLRMVDGLLTARGGSTSHASVTVPQLGKIGVVGLKEMKVYEVSGYCLIGDKRIESGNKISIDGWSGAVYLGEHVIEKEGRVKLEI